MARIFENPSNHHRASVNGWDNLAALLIGPLYFAVVQHWAAFLICLIVGIGLAMTGPGGIALAFLLQIIVACFAQSIIAARYLDKGWIEIETASTNPGQFASDFAVTERPTWQEPAPAAASAPESDYYPCPDCAEPVRKAAIKCRHCGRPLTPQ